MVDLEVPPAPAAPRTPTRLNPASLRARRANRERGFVFVLEETLDEDGNPSSARVRMPSLFDAQTLASLPDELRQEVFKLVEAVEGNPAMAEDRAELSVTEVAKYLGSVAHLVNAYCIAGFIEPRCYATAEEADARGGVWTDDIEFNDRMRFFEFCSARQKGGSAQAKPFPDGQPVSPVGTGPVAPAVSGTGEPERRVAPEPAAPAQWPS